MEPEALEKYTLTEITLGVDAAYNKEFAETIRQDENSKLKACLDFATDFELLKIAEIYLYEVQEKVVDINQQKATSYPK